MTDDRHLARAYGLAAHHRTHPNPRVGAVIVAANGRIIAEGAHAGPGHPHAEVEALSIAGPAAVGATLYVSLEPCTHHGRTPPCVDAIEAAGIARVVVGALDPDSRVSGGGVEHLLRAGVEVEVSNDTLTARSVDPAYFRHRETGMPRVTMKYAMTLDGSVAAADRTSQWITSTDAREDAHRLRAEVDAVVVGSGTVRADNPRLDVRLEGYEGAQPRPVVVAGTGTLPPDAAIWARDPIVVAATNLSIPSGELVRVPGDDGLPDPVATCRALSAAGLLHLLVEGGSTLLASWLKSAVVTDGIVYLGARLGMGRGLPAIGGVFETVAGARVVTVTGVRTLGPDVAVSFEL